MCGRCQSGGAREAETFVYASDVTDLRDKVEVVEIPDEVNVVADLLIATVRDSGKPRAGSERGWTCSAMKARCAREKVSSGRES